MPERLPAAASVVVIGRNEGDRLVRALAPLPPGRRVVYVDSGSIDGSPERARSQGYQVLELDRSLPFSAARARNAGFDHLLGQDPDLRYVQMLDGDCVLHAAWLQAATDYLDGDGRAAVVFGRCREVAPASSIYNALCDLEWHAPVGEAASSGGNAMFRAAALSAAGGFNASLIAGEEPDLCHRLRAAGWKIVSLPHDMVLHDAAMTRFGQWWKRTERGGFAFAQLVGIHGRNADPEWRKAVRSILLWGFALPCLLVASLALLAMRPSGGAWFLFCAALVLYPLQLWRIARRGRRRGLPRRLAWQNASFLLLGKFPQLIGWMRFRLRAASRTRQSILEYKAVSPPDGTAGTGGR